MTGRALAEARELIDRATRVVVLTGAGISTDSGIPDFRGPRGVWTLNPKAERMSNIHHYVADPEVRRLSWQSRLAHPAWTADPNEGHRALVALERRGKLQALITQNIDGLHQRAGNDADLVVEVHGTLHKAVCLRCGWKGPMQSVLDRVRGGEEDPPCGSCGGILKSDTISFGQPLVPSVIERAMRAAADADCLVAIGTSLQVYPIASVVPTARAAGASLIIVNAEPTPFDDIADVKLTESISAILPMLCGNRAA
jgi:NAD-dependent protein deacetylase/lipoamidase